MSESGSEDGEDDSKDEEVGNMTTLLSSLPTTYPWTLNFCSLVQHKNSNRRKNIIIISCSNVWKIAL